MKLLEHGKPNNKIKTSVHNQETCARNCFKTYYEKMDRFSTYRLKLTTSLTHFNSNDTRVRKYMFSKLSVASYILT